MNSISNKSHGGWKGNNHIFCLGVCLVFGRKCRIKLYITNKWFACYKHCVPVSSENVIWTTSPVWLEWIQKLLKHSPAILQFTWQDRHPMKHLFWHPFAYLMHTKQPVHCWTSFHIYFLNILASGAPFQTLLCLPHPIMLPLVPPHTPAHCPQLVLHPCAFSMTHEEPLVHLHAPQHTLVDFPPVPLMYLLHWFALSLTCTHVQGCGTDQEGCAWKHTGEQEAPHGSERVCKVVA